jgi:two-component system LytT family sensor kinase
LSYYLQDNKYFSIPYTAFGIVYYFLQSNRYKEVEKNELELQNRQAELEYLKSQINPHFLFNNLNSIYSLIYHKSDKALKAVEQLSSLLRYMLYEKNKEVLLTEEVDLS